MASFKSHQGIRAISTVIALGLCPSGWAVEFAGGTGEPDNPHQIATAEQLIAIGSERSLLNRHFALVNDTDMDPSLPGGRHGRAGRGRIIRVWRGNKPEVCLSRTTRREPVRAKEIPANHSSCGMPTVYSA